MLVAHSLFTASAIAAGAEVEASDGANKTFEKIIRRSTPSDAVTRLVVERNIPITYDYIATLLRIPNAFGEGAACVVCHSSNDPDKAYCGLNLSSCEGIIRGAMEAPVRGPAVVPGHPENSLIMRFLRNNRMPMGIPFDYPIDGKPILRIKKWINDGANNDDFFKQEVLTAFSARKAFGIFAACTDCHMSSSEPPSFNGLNLTSYIRCNERRPLRRAAKKGIVAKSGCHPWKCREQPTLPTLDTKSDACGHQSQRNPGSSEPALAGALDSARSQVRLNRGFKRKRNLGPVVISGIYTSVVEAM
ncbi:MAG: hypothetical protein GY802_02320 [Gammaproteobacteria bacterium]|nr:hypothetical protein [Gammaproteobacteria bacterium]